MKLAATFLLRAICAHGQFVLAKEQMIAYTADNPYERFPDGRPRKTTGTGMVVDGGVFWLGKVIPTGMPAYFRGTGPDPLNNVMLTGIDIPIRIGNATAMLGDVVLGDEEGLFFIPPHLVKEAIEAAQSTMARDEWIKSKMDLRQYKSSDLYGRPRDPALLKEMEEYQNTPAAEAAVGCSGARC